MNIETSSPSTIDVLLARVSRVTALDRVAIVFAAVFLFGFVSIAALAYFAIGDAPQGRMWGFLLAYAVIGFSLGIVAPWMLCRALHAAGHAAQITWARRTVRETEPLVAFLQGRVA